MSLRSEKDLKTAQNIVIFFICNIYSLSIRRNILNQTRLYIESLFSSPTAMENNKNIWKLFTKKTCKQVLSEFAVNVFQILYLVITAPNVIECFLNGKKIWNFYEIFRAPLTFFYEIFRASMTFVFFSKDLTHFFRFHKSYKVLSKKIASDFLKVKISY